MRSARAARCESPTYADISMVGESTWPTGLVQSAEPTEANKSALRKYPTISGFGVPKVTSVRCRSGFSLGPALEILVHKLAPDLLVPIISS